MKNVGDAPYVMRVQAARLEFFTRPIATTATRSIGGGPFATAQQTLNAGDARTLASDLVPWSASEFPPRVIAALRYVYDPDTSSGDCVMTDNTAEFDGAAIDRALASAGPDTLICPALVPPPPPPVTSSLFKANLNAPGRNLRGFVDLHTHPMAHLGFGGQLIHGAPDVGADLPPGMLYDANANFGDTIAGTGRMNCNKSVVQARSIEEAMGSCRATHGGKNVDGNNCGDEVRKQVVDKVDNRGGNHPHTVDHPLGAPAFDRWPKFNDIVHQQMWVDWIKRAYDGGMRVMVGLAVNSMTLTAGLRTDVRGLATGIGLTIPAVGAGASAAVTPITDIFLPGSGALLGGASTAGIFAGPAAALFTSGFKGNLPYDDQFTGYWQVQQLRAMVDRHSWMEVAYTSHDLRRIVQEDKLAVILGVELDDIGDFAWKASHGAGAPTEADVVREIHRLYDLGVRYAFPVHVIDNAFGGTAIYEPDLARASRFHSGAFPQMVCASPMTGVTLQTRAGVDPVDVLAVGPAGGPLPVPTNCARNVGFVNSRGLQSLGRTAIKEMMKLGMMIDVDHMSEKSVTDTLALTAVTPSGDPYPLASGHNGLRAGFETGTLGQPHPDISENTRTPTQYHQIAKRSGVVGIGWGGSNAQAWLTNARKAIQAVRALDDRTKLAINLGSDINGLVAQPFSVGCATSRCVQYSAAFPQATTVTRDRTKTWDYNVDGVAHIGLFPDFLRHVENIGGMDVVDRLFDGAESVAKMWETAERSGIAAQPWLKLGNKLVIRKRAGGTIDAPMGFQLVHLTDADASARANGRCTFAVSYSESNVGRADMGAFVNRIRRGMTILAEDRMAGLAHGEARAVDARIDLTPGQNIVVVRLNDGQPGHGVGLWVLDVAGTCR